MTISRDDWYRSIHGLRDEDLADGMTGPELEQWLMREAADAMADEVDRWWFEYMLGQGRLWRQRRNARRQRARRLAQRLGH